MKNEMVMCNVAIIDYNTIGADKLNYVKECVPNPNYYDSDTNMLVATDRDCEDIVEELVEAYECLNALREFHAILWGNSYTGCNELYKQYQSGIGWAPVYELDEDILKNMMIINCEHTNHIIVVFRDKQYIAYNFHM